MGALHFLFLNNDWNSRQGDPATGCSSMSRLIQVLTVCSYPYVQIFRIFTVNVIISVHNLWIKYGMSRIMRISVFRISHQSWHKSRCKITKDRQRLKVSDFECRGPSLTMWRKRFSAARLLHSWSVPLSLHVQKAGLLMMWLISLFNSHNILYNFVTNA